MAGEARKTEKKMKFTFMPLEKRILIYLLECKVLTETLSHLNPQSLRHQQDRNL